DPESAASSGTFFRAEIAVELAEQGIAVLLRPLSQLSDEVLNLLASGVAQSLGPAKISRIGLDQVGIELMLANDLAEAVADFGAAAVPIRRLWRKLFRLSIGL